MFTVIDCTQCQLVVRYSNIRRRAKTSHFIFFTTCTSLPSGIRDVLHRCFPVTVASAELFVALQGTLLRGSTLAPASPFGTLGSHSPNYSFNANGTMSPGSAHSLSFEGAMEPTLANTPHIQTRDALAGLLYRPRNLLEKARLNAR